MLETILDAAKPKAPMRNARGRLHYLLYTPFSIHRDLLSHPTSYAVSQVFGTRMRQADIELFTYFSARDPEGVNVGLFTFRN